jgi:hypothetical protein
MMRELRDTESAHLLEHVTMELAALAGSPRSLHADTSWDFAVDGRGIFRLRFDYDDDLVVLGALNAAVGVVEWLLGGHGEPPDIDAVVARLRAPRARFARWRLGEREYELHPRTDTRRRYEP